MFPIDRSPPGNDWFAPDAAAVALRLRERRAVAMTDLFLPASGRLRDDDRVAIARLLGGVVEAVERELRRRLGPIFAERPMLAESLLSTRIAIAWPILERGGGLRDAELVAALARRSEEARIAAMLAKARERSAELDPAAGASPIVPLCGDADPAVALASRRLIAAERERRDAAGGPILGSAELPAEVQHRLVWRIAAALRHYIVESHAVEPAEADPAIAQAAAAVLAGYDEAETLAALGVALARSLAAAGRLQDDLIVAAVDGSHVGFAVAALAVRAGVGWDAAWDMALDPERLLLLCGAAAMRMPFAAELALRLSTDDDETLADRLDRYESLTPPRAAAAIGLWRLDPAYLESIAALAGEAAR